MRNLKLDNVLQTIVRAISEVLDSPETGIYLWEESKRVYTLQETAGFDFWTFFLYP